MWIDHDFKTSSFFNTPYPAPMAGGELNPGERNTVNNGYSPGMWAVIWSDCWNSTWSSKRVLNISDSIRKIITTPMGDVMR